jgi:RNA polymerase sigma factor (sigma-70 family)
MGAKLVLLEQGKDGRLAEPNTLTHFEAALLPHLGAAYNLARWLTRNDHDAEDVVQEAYMRAFSSFASFHGSDGRGWILAIVRNTCYTWLQQNRNREVAEVFDEEVHTVEHHSRSPEAVLLQNANAQLLRDAVEKLPVEFREILVLRELEGLSYKEIADLVGIPVGTVMSRLARGRERLQRQLTHPVREGA